MARKRDQSARRQELIEATYAAGLDHGIRSLSLTDVAKEAGLTRGAILYYYEDLDALLVEAHEAGIARFCDDRDRRLAEEADPRGQLAIAIDAGLPTGPDDALMRLLYELDVLAGSSTLHERLVQDLDQRQLSTYRRVLERGVESGVFSPSVGIDLVAQTLVALEDGFGLQIVADKVTTHDEAVVCMRAVAGELGCPTDTDDRPLVREPSIGTVASVRSEAG
ncbi:TetR/AcrR family transcriptional regulator [Microbacterium sp. BH-3-3-3]|uniref:TetR/AcrR family transcriptional regulator n=1 Tax=Microbacterium sp. BH-3-3-3 TaxID=1906742 RepID=UPI0008929B27|nr:TetR family transcriptional regulator C-terminal domain-containing protein [Microbacterium sp. BH-3-3-3]AOX45883.1 TetR family transcriptional regulator [Microbacterium sp. BH-3-3-3]